MSRNNLLSSLFSGEKQCSTRPNSLFTKNLTTFNRSQSTQSRPLSVSKIHNFTNLKHEDLLKWTPLIKMTHKLASKMKKQYFFFWCRLESLLKTKIQLSQDHNKENKSFNVLNDIQKDARNQMLQDIGTHNKTIQIAQIVSPMKNCQNQQQKKYQKISDKKPEIYENIIQKEQFLKDKQTVLDEFTSILQTIKSKYFEPQLKLVGFKKIEKSVSKKKKLCQLLERMQFKYFRKLNKLEAFRKIKNKGNYIAKVQLLYNFIAQIYRKKELNYLKNSFSSFKDYESCNRTSNSQKKQYNSQNDGVANKQNTIETGEKNKIFRIQNKEVLQKQEHCAFINEIQKKCQVTLFLPKPAKNLHINKTPRMQFQVNLQEALPCRQLKIQDLMRKAKPLRAQQPISEVTDISQITIFNASIKFNCAPLFVNTCQTKNGQWVNQQLEDKSNYQSTPFERQTVNTKVCISPKMQRFQNLEGSSELDQTQKIENDRLYKSSSCADIPCDRKTRSKDLPYRNKKRSIQIFLKNINQKEKFEKDLIPSTARNKKSAPEDVTIGKEGFSTRKKNNGHKKQEDRIISKTNRVKSQKKFNFPITKILKNQPQTNSLSNVKKKFTNSSFKDKQYQSSHKKEHKKIIFLSNKNSSKKNIGQNKENVQSNSSRKEKLFNLDTKCSEFNSQIIQKKLRVLGYDEEVPMKRQALRQINANEGIVFSKVQMASAELTPNQERLEDYSTKRATQFMDPLLSQQLPRQKKYANLVGQNSKKLRKKVEKIEVNTAQKMKRQIEQMITQRKKSSIGLVKF